MDFAFARFGAIALGFALFASPAASQSMVPSGGSLPLTGGALTGNLSVNINSGALPSPQTGTVLQIGGANSATARFELDAFANTPRYTCVREDGTAASPTAIQSGDELCSLNAFGYGTSIIGPQAALRTYAAATWTGTSAPTYIDLATTPTGSTTLASVMRWEQDKGIDCTGVTGGDMGAGTINCGALYQGGSLVPSIVGAQTWSAQQTFNGGISENQSITGTYSPPLYANYTKILSDNANLGTGFGTAWGIIHNFGGSAMYGGREPFVVYSYMTAPSNALNGNRNYVSGTFVETAQSGDNGTGVTAGTALGGHFALGLEATACGGSTLATALINGNAYTILTLGTTNFTSVGASANTVGVTFTASGPGTGTGTAGDATGLCNGSATAATNLLELTDGEINIAAHAGSSIYYKSLLTLVGRSDDAVHGSGIDAMLSFSNQPGAVLWNYGIQFNNANSQWPIMSTGTMIGSTSGSAANGVDLSLVTFSGCAFKSSAFCINNYGNIENSNESITFEGFNGGIMFEGVVDGNSASSTDFPVLHALPAGDNFVYIGPSGPDTNIDFDIVTVGSGNIRLAGGGATPWTGAESLEILGSPSNSSFITINGSTSGVPAIGCGPSACSVAINAPIVSSFVPAYNLGGTLAVAALFNPAAATTVPAGDELDIMRCSQSNGQSNTFTVPASPSLVSCLSFYMESLSGSNATSNLYGVIGNVYNDGPGITKAIYGRAEATSGSTAADVTGLVASTQVDSGAAVNTAMPLEVQMTIVCNSVGSACGTATQDFFERFETNTAIQYATNPVVAQNGLVSINTVEYSNSFITAYTGGGGDFLEWLTNPGAAKQFYVDYLGDVITTGYLTAPTVNVTNIDNAAGLNIESLATGASNIAIDWPNAASSPREEIIIGHSSTVAANSYLAIYNGANIQDELQFGTSTYFNVNAGCFGIGAQSCSAELTVTGSISATTSVTAAVHIAGGTVPTGAAGSCAASSFAGGSTAGKFSAAACAAGTIILSGLPTAPTGYACDARDETTTADTLYETSNTTTSVTFLATTASSDAVVFKCMAY